MTQSELWPSRLDARFTAYHRDNPHVYALFQRFALEAVVAGKTRIGAKAIAERIRWSVEVETRGDDFKLNNSYVSRYARLLAQDDQRLATLFRFRGLKS